MNAPLVENYSWEENSGVKNVNDDCGWQVNTEENKGIINVPNIFKVYG